MHLSNKPNIVIVGATGVVGTTLLSLIRDRNFTYNEISLLASPKSVGKEVVTPSGIVRVQDLEKFQFNKTDIAFFSAGSQISLKHAKRAVKDGALFIDNTNAFRMEENVPLVVPQVNIHEIRTRPKSGVIANPNCSTIPLVRLLKSLNDNNEISSVLVSTYQAALGAGQSRIEELKNSARNVVVDDFEFDANAKRFAHPLGFNLIPNIDIPLASGFTLEEQKMLQETRKILNLSNFKLSATCVRVPVINAYSEAVYIKFKNTVNRERVVRLLRDTDETLVFDEGQGISGNGDLTWLGKNSSDLSAIIIASELGLGRCEIYSDVPGIFSADPNKIAQAILLDKLSYGEALKMSISGAKVIHNRAIKYSSDYEIELVFRFNSFPFDQGSTVGLCGNVKAVVDDDRSKIFHFKNNTDISIAQKALLDYNIPFVNVSSVATHTLAVTCGFSRPEHVFTEIGLSFHLSDQKLLSVLNGGEIERIICANLDELKEQAQFFHDQLQLNEINFSLLNPEFEERLYV